jgi:RecB family exonuclease
MASVARRFVVSVSAERRLAAAREWLLGRRSDEEVLVVAASGDAGAELVRSAAAGRGAAFGWRRATLGLLATELAAPELAARGLAPIGALAGEAVAQRVVHGAAQRGELGRYVAVADSPGFARALARTLAELRLGRVEPGRLRSADPVLAALLEAFESELASAGLVDRAGVLALAVAAAGPSAPAHPWVGLPALFLDLPVESVAEEELVGAVARRARDLFASSPAGDRRGARRLQSALGVEPEGLDAAPPASGLAHLQAHLFGPGAPPAASAAESDHTVTVFSAPGEGRECVEIARRLLEQAEAGVPFDRMAVLLRSPNEYRPHLEEALGRAGIPCHFARGVVRPDPSGRAFLALLRCAAEGLSVRRFAEYLSLGEVPEPTPGGAPPPAAPAAERWAPPDTDLVPARLAAALADAGSPDPAATAGSVVTPRRWEALLVESAVIGGLDRWRRRLEGLRRQIEVELAALEDPDDPLRQTLRQRLADLARLRDFALPLLEDLAGLPAAAPWGDWLARLSALASRALRAGERVQAVLAELAPMSAVGPVNLAEVGRVLARQLLELTLAPDPHRYGKVYVAAVGAARGLGFEVVFVPGLAEKLFPGRVAEEPILLDAARRALGVELETNDERIAAERLALRLGAGAARSRLVLSYPRLDLDAARPRVASFYALEALRAAEGKLPLHDELAGRAEAVAAARIGWPAPAQPGQAIDDAEYDLAVLEALVDRPPEETRGVAHYLLAANPHLGRALRFRARRWLRRWSAADGLVQPSAAGAAALAAHDLAARSYSPTALQQFAVCPYKFYLYAVLKLARREEPVGIEEMDPLQRGSLVHAVQFALLTRLDAEGRLPVVAENLAAASALLDEVLDEVAAVYRDDLAPAIERVWEDGVAAVRADLREWLRRMSEDRSGFVPWRFELAFGLADQRARDAASVAEPVLLASGLRLRGSIDLVERGPQGVLRVTDHKTGKQRAEAGDVMRGGEALQPVLYALASERLFPEARVVGGRLAYCTAAGGFTDVDVPLDEEARESAQVVAEVVGGALAAGFLPAAPAAGACRWCDYREVCGPYEELRVRRKPPRELEPLERLRGLR